MKRFLFKVGRFFWSKGFLKFVLWAITLIIFFYVEEDWRGARAWAKTKAEWEAKGETFDFNKFIPPPIPDDQNLAAIPLFKLERRLDPETHKLTDPMPVNLREAMREWHPGHQLPPLGHWMNGRLPDFEEMRKKIATSYQEAFSGQQPPNGALAQFEALYPFMADLRAAAAVHPDCRFNFDYLVMPPFFRPVTLLMDTLTLSKIFTAHALLSLENHQSDLALADLKTIQKLQMGVRRDPTLIAGLVDVAMTGVSGVVIYEGLAVHAWNDTQLAEIQHLLGSIDFLSEYQFSIRGETTELISTLDYVKEKNRSILKMITGVGMLDAQSNWEANYIFARGWLDQAKSQSADFHMQSVRATNPAKHRVFPETTRQVNDKLDSLRNSWCAFEPWNVLFVVNASALKDALMKFAQIQVLVDETRIACGLERYRLTHGAYPDSLNALTPAYISALPHDILNGEPYHYRIQSDGTFLLYSVGWNQKDDGGEVVYTEKNPLNPPEPKEGDWVWPLAKGANTK